MAPKAKRRAPVNIIEDARVRAQRFSDKATLLSKALDEAQSVLQSLPGKVEVRIPTDVNDLQLSFSRYHSQWYLYILTTNGNTTEYQQVGQSPVEHKIIAARFLPDLYQALCDNLARNEDAIEEGLAKLSTLAFLDANHTTRSLIDEQEVDDEDIAI